MKNMEQYEVDFGVLDDRILFIEMSSPMEARSFVQHVQFDQYRILDNSICFKFSNKIERDLAFAFLVFRREEL